MNISTIGLDIAKEVFQVHGVDKMGKTVLKKRLSRKEVLPFLGNVPACLIGIEACGGSHYWHRQLTKLGHNVKLISPHFVKPYIKSQKNDANDAEGICEAVSRPTMRFVPPKSMEQQDIQSLHRIRERLIKERTALVNEIRGLLAEYGIVVKKGNAAIRKTLPLIIEDASNELTFLARESFQSLYEELKEKDQRVDAYTQKLETLFKENKACQRIAEIEGIGLITATAIVAAIGDATLFKNGRHVAAWLGLVPKQHSSGGKQTLLGITKRGDNYIRKCLVHGARSVVYRAKKKTDPRSCWINKIRLSGGPNKASVALANKNARIIWALLVREERYQKAA